MTALAPERPVPAPAAPVDRQWPLPGAAAVVAVTNAIVVVEPVSPVRAVVVLPVLVLLPGALALRAAGIRRPAGWDALLHTVAAGLLVLIAASFVLAVLPIPGALSATGGILAFDLAVLVLGAVAAARPYDAPPPVLRWTAPPVAAAGVGVGAVAVVLAVAGALRPSAGHGPGPAEAALAAAAVALTLAAFGTTRTPGSRAGEQVAATTVYLVALAVLLTTSLRGAVPTGGDPGSEYRALADTLARGAWEPGGEFSAYNSCLSLTTLPAFLARVLGIDALDVFRVCFQLVFACVPVVVFLLARRVLSVAGSVLAAGLFVAFPTFVEDLPTLARQEIALLFAAVALLAATDTTGPRRRAVFVAMTAGATVSDPSTAYVAAGTLLSAWVLLALRQRSWRWHTKPIRGVSPGVLALPVVLSAVLMALLWGVWTGVGTGTAFPALAAAPVSDADALRAYTLTAGVHPSPPTLEALRTACPVTVASPDVRPGIASAVSPALVGAAPAAWARWATLLLFAVGGALAVLSGWLRSRRSRGPDAVLAVLAAGAVVVLTAIALVPALSRGYGVPRVYQQGLLVLAPAIVVLLAEALSRTGRASRPILVAVVAGTLVTTSGPLPQLLGADTARLNPGNGGPYVRASQASAADVDTARWIRAHLPPGTAVYADSVGTASLRDSTGAYPVEGVAPGTVDAGAHLVVHVDGAGEARAVAVLPDRVLVYTFPAACVTGGRPLLHSTGDQRVYGPVG